MSHDETMSGTDRRTFLQAGALATAAAVTSGAGLKAQDAKKDAGVPRRVLGKTGASITMIDQGFVRGSSTDQFLRLSYSLGVRTFDTAKVYGSEPNFKKWFEAMPEVRKEIFLVTKDEMDDPGQIAKSVDERLEALGTDHIDLFFFHGLGDKNSLDHNINLVKSKELAKAADAIKKTGKVKFIGFSIHCKERAAIIQAAAEANIVDAIMSMNSPFMEKDDPLNKAFDACHKSGVGLISMKQTMGRFLGEKGVTKGQVLKDVARRVPMLAEKKLSPFQGLLHAIWTDERFTSVCTSMRNRDEIRENIDAARRFEPLKLAEIRQLRDAVLAHAPTHCSDCDGRCSLAAGTTAELGHLTRFLTYHEHQGDRVEARRQYAALPAEAKAWAGADLEAARQACPSKLNFAQLLPEVDRNLA